MPINPKQLKPKLPNVKLIQKRELNNKKKQKQNFDRRHRARNLRQLKPGNNVWLKDQKCPGVVKTCLDLPRSYVIKTQEGDVRRNRSHVVDKQQSTETETGQHAESERVNEDGMCENKNMNEIESRSIENENSNGSGYVTRSGRLSKAPIKLDL